MEAGLEGIEGLRAIHPMPGFVLVRQEEAKSPSGIVLPGGQKSPNQGMVVEVGSPERGGFGTAAIGLLEEGMTVWWLPDRGLDVDDYVIVLAESLIAFEK